MSRAVTGGPQLALGPGLDPALPDLVKVIDAEEAARRFERFWPGPPLHGSIRGCVLENVRWSPGVGCVATYRLTLAPSANFPAAVFGVVTADPNGVSHRLFTSDADLPGLTLATDPMVMRLWLAEHLSRPVDSCSITPVRYWPGERCVLRYEVSAPESGVLYAKVMAGDRVADLATTITSLGERLAAPLIAISRELRLLLQADAGERSLSSIGHSPPSDTDLADVQAAGRLLSRLHLRSGPPGRHLSAVEDARDLSQYLAACDLVSPATAARFTEGIERVRALTDAAQPAPSHGAFRLDQVHISAGEPVLIDLDSYCWADPARDLGNLFAYLTWRCIRLPSSSQALTQVRDAFLVGYSSAMPGRLDMMQVRAFEGASLLKIAGRSYRKLAVEHWDLIPKLVDAALERLGSGKLTRS